MRQRNAAEIKDRDAVEDHAVDRRRPHAEHHRHRCAISSVEMKGKRLVPDRPKRCKRIRI